MADDSFVVMKEASPLYRRASGGAFYLILGTGDLYNREPKRQSLTKERIFARAKRIAPHDSGL